MSFLQHFRPVSPLWSLSRLRLCLDGFQGELSETEQSVSFDAQGSQAKAGWRTGELANANNGLEAAACSASYARMGRPCMDRPRQLIWSPEIEVPGVVARASEAERMG